MHIDLTHGVNYYYDIINVLSFTMDIIIKAHSKCRTYISLQIWQTWWREGQFPSQRHKQQKTNWITSALYCAILYDSSLTCAKSKHNPWQFSSIQPIFFHSFFTQQKILTLVRLYKFLLLSFFSKNDHRWCIQALALPLCTKSATPMTDRFTNEISQPCDWSTTSLEKLSLSNDSHAVFLLDLAINVD